MCFGTGWEREARLLVCFEQSCLEACLRLRHVTPSISGGFIKSMELKVKNYWWDYVSQEFFLSSSFYPCNNPGKHYYFPLFRGEGIQAQSKSYQGKMFDGRSGSRLWSQHLGGRGRLGLYSESFSQPLPYLCLPIIVIASLSNCYVGKTGGLSACDCDYHIEYCWSSQELRSTSISGELKDRFQLIWYWDWHILRMSS